MDHQISNPNPQQLLAPSRKTDLSLSKIALAVSVGIAGIFTCQSGANAALSAQTDLFAAASKSSLLRSPDFVSNAKFSSKGFALPQLTSAEISSPSDPAAFKEKELQKVGIGASTLAESTTTLNLQISPPVARESRSLTNSESVDTTLEATGVRTELSQIIASLPTLNNSAHRSLAIAETSKIASLSLPAETSAVSLKRLTAQDQDISPQASASLPASVSQDTEPTIATNEEPESSPFTLAQRAKAENLDLQSSAEALASSNQPVAEQSGQKTLAAVPEPEPAVSLSSGPELSVSVAKRTVIPQIPAMDLPPLASADTYLPRGTGGNQPSTTKVNFISPARGVFTSGYGWRWGRMHRGIDIAGPVGTTIMASAPGVVSSAGWNSGGYGNLVEVRHPDGTLTVYAHNSRIVARSGQQVQQGQKIAEMGSTGRSTGPHVHFEIRPRGGGAVNPLTFLSRG